MLQIHDRVLVSHSEETLIALTLLLGILYSSMACLNYSRSALFNRVAYRAEQNLSSTIYNLAIEQARSYKPSAANEIMQDFNKIKRFLSGPIPSTIFDAPWVPLIILFIWSVHWILGAIATSGALLICIFAITNRILSQKPSMNSSAHFGKAQKWTRSIYKNIDSAVSMGIAHNVRIKWQDHLSDGASEWLKVGDVQGKFTSIIKALRMFLQSLMLGTGALLVIQNEITPGTMIAIALMTGRALAPIQQLVGQWQSISETMTSYQRLNEKLMEYNSRTQPSLELPAPTGNITIKNLFAAQPNSEIPFLKEINFSIYAGQSLGIIGDSGSGKTMLAKIMTGIWTPLKGTVRIDGATYDQWEQHQFGKFIGYLPQDIELFTGTVRENISRFESKASSENIIEAATIAGIHDLILKLVNGYDTMLGENGLKLSSGQRQRIAFARAIYGLPPLIVLDEPNSNLDSAGERALNHAIAKLKEKGKTIVVISHREGVMAQMDKIAIMESGCIQYFGSREKYKSRMSSLTNSEEINNDTVTQGEKIRENLRNHADV